MINKINLKKNKDAVRFLIIIFFFVGGYTFFFSSMYWMPSSADASYLTKLGEVSQWNDREVTINRWEYSEKQCAMEVELSVGNKSYDGKNRYQFSAQDLRGRVLDCETRVEEDDWIIIRIKNIPSKWSDISLRMEIKGDDKDRLKLYTNIVDVDKVEAFEELDRNGYLAKRFDTEIKNLLAEKNEKNNQIVKLKNEIGEVKKEIDRITDEKVYQTDKEKAASDSLIADAQGTITSKEKEIENLTSDIDEINKRIEMKEKEKSDLGV